MANLHKLVVSLYANTSEFAKGLSTAERQWNKFKKTSAGVTRSLATGVAVGITATAAALAALAIRQAHVIDGQAKLARSLGVSLRGFQSLSLVASEAGVDQEGLASALRKTQQAIVEAAAGGKQARLEFKALGLNFSELTKLSPDKQFEKIALALDAIQNPAEKTALAIKIFGKSGGDIIPLLEDFTIKSKEAAIFMERFGVSVNEIDARIVEQANDKFGRLGKILEGVGNIIAVKVAPLISKFSDFLVSIAPDAQQTGSVVDRVFRFIGKSIDLSIISIKALRIGVNELSFAFDKFVYSASRNLIAFIEQANQIPSLSGKFDAIKMSLYDINAEAAKSGLATKEFINALEVDLGNYVSVYDDFLRISEEARKQASEDEAKRSRGIQVGSSGTLIDAEQGQKISDILNGLRDENSLMGINIRLAKEKESVRNAAIKKFEIERKLSEEGIKLSAEKSAAVDNEIRKYEMLSETLRRVQEEEEKRKQLSEDLANSVSSAFEDAIINGKKLSDALKGLARDIVNTMLRAQIKNSIAPLAEGFGGFLSKGIGSIFGSFLPSFDVGSNFVPRDMMANIHKGEMIIPAKEASAIRSGGFGGANVVQNISIGAGVTAAVRQEVAKMLPDIKRATTQGVEEAKFRGATV